MTVRRQITLCFALVAIGLGAGCGGGDPGAATPEVDDPYYRQGQQLVKQGRPQEALGYYLKAIAHRGELSSAESHLEAGVIYLNHSQDPVEAYHHFRQYLSQQPNSRDSARVRELLNTSKRELFRTLAGQPADNSSTRELLDKIENLQRTNDALRAEIEAMRNSANAPILRQTRTPLTIEPPVVRTVAPETTTPVIPVDEPSPITPMPVTSRDAPAAVNPPPSQARPVPTRPTNATAPQSTTAPRRHVVVQGDTLFGLTKKYYGAASSAKADAIYEANRDIMKSKGDLRPGMEIKIP